MNRRKVERRRGKEKERVWVKESEAEGNGSGKGKSERGKEGRQGTVKDVKEWGGKQTERENERRGRRAGRKWRRVRSKVGDAGTE